MIPLRTRRHPPTPKSDYLIEKIRQLCAQKITQSEISVQLGIGQRTVARWRIEHGIEGMSRSEGRMVSMARNKA